MRIKKVRRQIKVTKQSLEEIRRENHPYFAALAAQIGEKAAQEAEDRYLKEIASELDSIVEGETTEVSMVEISTDGENDNPTTRRKMYDHD